MTAHPFRLAHTASRAVARPSTVTIHGHHEGEPCDDYCYQVPTLRARLRKALSRVHPR